MRRYALGILLGGSAVETLNLLAEHHWIFAAAAGVVAFFAKKGNDVSRA